MRIVARGDFFNEFCAGSFSLARYSAIPGNVYSRATPGNSWEFLITPALPVTTGDYRCDAGELLGKSRGTPGGLPVNSRGMNPGEHGPGILPWYSRGITAVLLWCGTTVALQW
jgi:hypothetical protein